MEKEYKLECFLESIFNPKDYIGVFKIKGYDNTARFAYTQNPDSTVTITLFGLDKRDTGQGRIYLRLY